MFWLGAFLDTLSVVLVGSNGTEYPTQFKGRTYQLADNRYLIDKIDASVDPRTLPVGSYSVKVTWTREDLEPQYLGNVLTYVYWDQLPNALTITHGGTAVLQTKLIVPNPVGFHQAATIYVEFSNTGDTSMPAPVLVVSATQNGIAGALLTLDQTKLTQGLWTSSTPDGFAQSVQILASGATPGVLAPGEKVRVPVYYAGWLRDQW